MDIDFQKATLTCSPTVKSSPEVIQKVIKIIHKNRWSAKFYKTPDGNYKIELIDE